MTFDQSRTIIDLYQDEIEAKMPHLSHLMSLNDALDAEYGFLSRLEGKLEPKQERLLKQALRANRRACRRLTSLIVLLSNEGTLQKGEN